MNIFQHVEKYVEHKQRIGFSYKVQARLLRSFARFADGKGDEFLSSARIKTWAAQSSSNDMSARRFRLVRNFAIWLHAEDERHEVPPRGALASPKSTRRPPTTLSVTQINEVMEKALLLPPRGTITPQTYFFSIGLLASTGLRCLESISLRLSDICDDGLVVRETKFRKSRIVPIDSTVREELEKYLSMRRRIVTSDDHLLVLATGRALPMQNLANVFHKLVRQVEPWSITGARAPTLHSLRHSFAVRSLETASEDSREEVSRHVLALSTYLGHSSVSGTYWYLKATPVLLRKIAEATELAHKRSTSK